MKFILAALILFPPHAEAGRLFACLKRDGDWVHGLSKKECRALRGRWLPPDSR